MEVVPEMRRIIFPTVTNTDAGCRNTARRTIEFRSRSYFKKWEIEGISGFVVVECFILLCCVVVWGWGWGCGRGLKCGLGTAAWLAGRLAGAERFAFSLFVSLPPTTTQGISNAAKMAKIQDYYSAVSTPQHAQMNKIQ